MTYPAYSSPLPVVRLENLQQLTLQSFLREDITIYAILSMSP